MASRRELRIILDKAKADEAREVHEHYGVALPKLLYPDVVQALKRLHESIPPENLANVKARIKAGR